MKQSLPINCQLEFIMLLANWRMTPFYSNLALDEFFSPLVHIAYVYWLTEQLIYVAVVCVHWVVKYTDVMLLSQTALR